MNRTWSSITALVAAAAASFSLAGEWPLLGNGPVAGDMVDVEVPATYRLPPTAAARQDASSYDGVAPAANDLAPSEVPGITPSVLMGSSDTEALAVSPETNAMSELAPVEPPPEAGELSLDHAAAGGVYTDTGPAQAPVDLGLMDFAPFDELRETRPTVKAFAGRDRDTAGRSAGIVPIAAFPPTNANLTEQMLPAVQRGFAMARRKALYAAKTEFVQVLRRIAQANDAATNSTMHSAALASGLRTIDEAEDFMPGGVQLEGDIDVRMIASTHRTDVLPAGTQPISPYEAVALYHGYAQQRLEEAVAHEQAGSMALHGLGVVHSQLADREDGDVRLSRYSMTMYSAALGVCPNNHLAANELGVIVYRSGRPAEAVGLFQQAIDFAPSAIAYHNLAMAQQRLGLAGQAAANESESQRLAAKERSRGEVSQRTGVRWVTPEELKNTSPPIDRSESVVSEPQPVKQPESKSRWQRVVDSTRSLAPGGKPNQQLGPMQPVQAARPTGGTQGSSAPQWR